jgi:HAD superfamily hydrolase (TIGR01662 family)
VLYPGVKEVLEFLRQKGIIVALATNKITEISKKILRSLEIEGYFYTVMGPESVKKRKPDPEIIRILLDKINVPAERTMMIGDSEMDVFCGKNAGTFTCAVTYGLGTLESIVKSGPDFLICDLRKIKLLIS